jgi:hypothetical protein
MMKNKFLVVGLAAAALAGACSDEFPTISSLAPVKEFFEASLEGANERPTPVTTSASGSSTVTILDTNRIRVETWISTIDSVTQSHIHAGDANTAGPIMIFLLSNVAAGRAPVTGTNRILSVVEITRTSTFSGVFTFDSLMTRINEGTAYVNVHTRRNPGGEIRGQIVPE